MLPFAIAIHRFRLRGREHARGAKQGGGKGVLCSPLIHRVRVTAGSRKITPLAFLKRTCH